MATFNEQTGSNNPFDSIDIGSHSKPIFADVDGDGDTDLVFGEKNGRLEFYQNTGSDTNPNYVEKTGSDNPFNAIDVGSYSALTLADVDGDGDQDAVIGEKDGNLNYYKNTGSETNPNYVKQTGSDNPFNAIDVGSHSAPTLADIDGDGDRDLVIGEKDGNLNYYKNTGDSSNPNYLKQTGSDNPFNAIDVGSTSIPTFADIDGDGDRDLVIGERDGYLNYFQNTGSETNPNYVEKTGSDNPFDGIDVGYVSAPTFIDIDGDGDLDAVVGKSKGNLNYFQNDTPLNTAPDAVNDDDTSDEDTATTGDVLDNDTPVANTAPVAVNDSDTTDEDTATTGDVLGNDSDVDGDTLTVTQVNGESVDIGKQITLESGAFLTLNADGTYSYDPNGKFERLSQGDTATYSFTYTVSDGNDTSSATVDITINGVNDGPVAVNETATTIPIFNEQTGSNTIDIGSHSKPIFADVDGDGDLDAVFGEKNGRLEFYQNTGSETNPNYVKQSGSDNPFNGIDVGSYSVLTLADVDGDGDLDAVIGEKDGNLNYYQNTGSDTSPNYVKQSGSDNPFNGIDVGSHSAPTLADIDGDGDTDLVVGEKDGNLNYYQNTGDSSNPNYLKQSGSDNPFDGIDVGSTSIPTFTDIDRDGDRDLVVGERDGYLNYFQNTGSDTNPNYVEKTGSDNPFDGIDVGYVSAPTFIDIDGDGDVDAVVGESYGNLKYFENTGEQDILEGGSGADTFVLGDEFSSFYLYGSDADQAIIRGFEQEIDQIQLHGMPDFYLLEQTDSGNTNIFETSGRGQELIGTVENTTGLDLNDSSTFTFVGGAE